MNGKSGELAKQLIDKLPGWAVFLIVAGLIGSPIGSYFTSFSGTSDALAKFEQRVTMLEYQIKDHLAHTEMHQTEAERKLAIMEELKTFRKELIEDLKKF